MSAAVELFSQKLSTGLNAARRCSDVAIAHGFLGNSGNWATVGKKLTEHPLVAERLRCGYALDMRNHGRSPHTSHHSNALMASDVEKFVAERMLPPSPLNIDQQQTSGQHILIGHSMGGAVMMNAVYRRWQEKNLRRRAAVSVDGQDNVAAMNAVEAATGSGPMWAFSPNDATQHTNRVAAVVIVDITPTVSNNRPRTFDAVQADLNAMRAMDLGSVRTVQEGTSMLEALGVQSSQMRNFLLTNLERCAPSGPSTYRWKCNLDVLCRDFGNILLPQDTFGPLQPSSASPTDTEEQPHSLHWAPCPIPMLFVFGERSPYYQNREERDKIGAFFSNVDEVVIPDAGHFVHYETMDAFVECVAPFVHEHMGI